MPLLLVAHGAQSLPKRSQQASESFQLLKLEFLLLGNSVVEIQSRTIFQSWPCFAAWLWSEYLQNCASTSALSFHYASVYYWLASIISNCTYKSCGWFSVVVSPVYAKCWVAIFKMIKARMLIWLSTKKINLMSSKMSENHGIQLNIRPLGSQDESAARTTGWQALLPLTHQHLLMSESSLITQVSES